MQTIKPLIEKQRQEAEGHRGNAETPSLAAPKLNLFNHTQNEALDREESPAAIQSGKVVDPTTEDEKLFFEELSLMADYQGFETNFEPLICGRKIPLFKLWQVVNSTEFGGYDEVRGRNLWWNVARKLNFSDFKHSEAAEAIKSAYEVILPEFEVSREEYIQSLKDEEMIQDQLQATAGRDSMHDTPMDGENEIARDVEEESDDYDDDSEAPASLPRRLQSPSSKRNLESDDGMNQDGSHLLGTHQKRQRIDKGKGKEKEVAEIPSTPEDVINPGLTPGHVYKSSPLKFQLSAAEEGSDSDEEFPSLVRLPNFIAKRQVKRILEPETQDFNFRGAESQPSMHPLRKRRKEKNFIPAAPSSIHDGASIHSRADSQKEQQMLAFIDQHVALGYPQEIVVQALESTNMTTGDAALVMEELMKGNAIPDNIQGVWTSTDDAALDDEESEEYERLMMKHGTKNVNDRKKYFLYIQD